jgi:hypothetical protein
MFPHSFIVFPVRQDKADVDDFVLTLDFNDQAILVAGDIENRGLPCRVGMRIIAPDFDEVVPHGFAGSPIPIVEGFSRIGVFGRKLHKRFPADDSHFSMFP